MTDSKLSVAGENIYNQVEQDMIHFLNYPPDEVQMIGHQTFLLIKAIGIEIEKIEKKISNIEKILEDVATLDVGNIPLR